MRGFVIDRYDGWRVASGWVLATIFGVGIAMCPPAARSAAPETRATMQDIFAAMRPLLLLALEDEHFQDPARRAEIGGALALLERSSAQLAQHGKRRGPGFEHLGALLASDGREAHRRWREGDAEAARFLVLQVTETCIACHSRLPSESDTPLSKRFIDERVIAALPLDKRATVQYATRQFSTALESYETLLADENFAARDIDLSGHLDEYLEICIRVRNEPARAANALRHFAARNDTPSVLRQEVEHWITALGDLPRTEEDSLERAQALVRQGARPAKGWSERDGLVESIAAGAILHRLLEAGISDREERAHALYLLGVIDTRVGRSFWLSQAETFLAAAIRAAPDTDVARASYDLLEDYLVAGYTGSSGENVPPDIQEQLDRLRALLNAPAAGTP